MNPITEPDDARGRTIALPAIAMVCLTLISPQTSQAESSFFELDDVVLQTSLYTRHFDPEPEYNNDQDLISIELHNPDRWLAGVSWLKNSYDQPTWYVFGGREFSLWQPHPQVEFHAKITAGLLHGYDGEHRDAIPFNKHGTAPAILPSVGASIGHLETDLVLFSTSGVMWTGGVRF